MPTINGKACVANGRNLIVQSDLKSGYLNRDDGSVVIGGGSDFHSDNYIATNGATVFTFSSPDYAFKGSGNHTLAMYDSDKKYLGYQSPTSPTQTLSKSNVAYIRFSINFTNEGGTAGQLSDWLSAHRYKLEKGSLATPLTPAPVDKVFSNGKQVYGRNYFLDSKTRTITPPGTANYDWRIIISNDLWSNPDRLKSNNIKISFTLSAQKALTADFNSSLYFSAPPWYSTPLRYPAGTTAPIKYKLIFYITDPAFKTDNCFIRFQAKDTSDFPFVLENAKLEIGTFTPWTPAPEEVM